MPVEINHPDYWTEALQFTPTVHRDVYASLSPSNERIRRIAKDKVVLITGAGSGFGKVRSIVSSYFLITVVFGTPN
jgi:hypothetical protein